MKSTRKDKIVDYEQIESAKLEKFITHETDHPFIVKMYYLFQNDVRVYFLLEYVPGGELFKHIVENKRIPEERAQFFGASVALAIGHLHQSKILYRDLKPENVLIGQDGYICLTDFGLSRMLEKDELAMSFCGTPEYLAPEMIMGEGHDQAVDWWALGVLIYEMIVGIPPFYHKKREVMFRMIKEKSIKYPDLKRHGIYISDEAKDLINQLMMKDPTQRLGTRPGEVGVDKVMGHPFFEGLDLDNLMLKQLEPTWIPEIGDKFDVSNFDSEVTNLSAKESLISEQERTKIRNTVTPFIEDFDSLNTGAE